MRPTERDARLAVVFDPIGKVYVHLDKGGQPCPHVIHRLALACALDVLTRQWWAHKQRK